MQHAGLTASMNMNVYVNAFYMPMFFLISGYFLRIKKYSIETYLYKKIKYLLIPYVIWGIFHLCIWILLYIIKPDAVSEMPSTMVKGLLWDNNRHFPIAGALWFISCLFVVSIFAYIIIKYFGNRVYTVLSVAFGCMGVFNHISMPWSCDSAMTANFFFMVGYNFSKYGNKIRRFFAKSPVIVCWMVDAITIIVFCLFASLNGFTNIRECFYGNIPLLYLLIAVIGIAGWWASSYILTCRMNIHPRLLSWIGENSMPYVCLNQLILSVLSRLYSQSILCQFVESIITIFVIGILVKMLKVNDKTVKLYNILFGR